MAYWHNGILAITDGILAITWLMLLAYRLV